MAETVIITTEQNAATTTDNSIILQNQPENVLVLDLGDQTLIVQDNGESVVGNHEATTIMVEAPSYTIVEASAGQGPPGPAGPPGQGGTTFITLRAGEPLSGHQAVRSVGDLVYAASSSVQAHAHQVIGITLNSAQAGEVVQVQTSGVIVEPSWNWAPEIQIFLGVNGALTQVPPSAGFVLTLANIMSPTKILVGLRMPIFL